MLGKEQAQMPCILAHKLVLESQYEINIYSCLPDTPTGYAIFTGHNMNPNDIYADNQDSVSNIMDVHNPYFHETRVARPKLILKKKQNKKTEKTSIPISKNIHN